MYMPKHFEITDKEEIFSFIEANAFGQLISNVGGRLFSTHLPFLVSDELSQNCSRQDQDQVVKQLKLRGSDQLAKAMEDAG